MRLCGPAAQDARQDFERGIVLIAAQATQVAEGKESLQGVLLLGEKDAGRGRVLYLREFGDRRLLYGPIGKELLDGRLHFGGIEIAPNAQHHVGRKKVSLVERAQVVARDAVDGVVLLLPPERTHPCRR